MGKSASMRPKRLGAKLAQIRAAFGLSQNEMIVRLGFSGTLIREEISAFELGKREPPLPVLLEYARLSGVFVDVLIDDGLDLPDDIPPSTKHPGIRRWKPRVVRGGK